MSSTESTEANNYLTIAYINPASSAQFTDIASYQLADGTPAIDVVCIFGGNYASNELPYLRANNNDPPTTNPFNENIQQVLDDGSVQTLQAKGLKVLMTVLNGHAEVGWSEFTLESDAAAFAEYLKTEVVDRYGLDGIDIDDEWSDGTPNDTSLIMVTSIMRQLMPDKLITKALWSDLEYFTSSYQGRTLSDNLDYGWEMTYGVDPQFVLPPYVNQGGMNANTVSKGFWSGSPSPDSSQNVQWIKDNGYGGVMIFSFETQANIDYMGQLVNYLYGPGNWNYNPG